MPSLISVLAALLLLAIPLQAHDKSPLASSTQVVVVTTSDWNAAEGTLQRFERASPGKKWKAVGEAFPVVVGKNGLGWGSGVMSTDKVRAPSDPVKKEGDGKAPAGVFLLSSAFGYASQKQSGWKMPYTPLTQSVECVDDANSHFYNRVLDRTGVSPDWNSSEHMLRTDDLYRWGVVVDHNAQSPAPGGGSCIFLHIWRGPGMPTVGRTAMPQPQLESLLECLDASRSPMLVQLPVAQYMHLNK